MRRRHKSIVPLNAVPTSVRLRPDVLRRLKRLALERKTDVSELIRNAIDAELKRAA